MSNTDKEQNKNNMAVDDIMKQISDFSEKLHAKNQKRIKNGIICYTAYFLNCIICRR